MLYLKETFFRIIYLSFLFLTNALVVSLYEEQIILILNNAAANDDTSLFEFAIILIGPKDYFSFKIEFIFFLSAIITAPFIIFQLYDFYKSGIDTVLDKKIKNFLLSWLLLFYLSNYATVAFIVPEIWQTFIYLIEDPSSILNVEYNMGLEHYLKTLFLILNIINIFFILYTALTYALIIFINKKIILRLIKVKDIIIYIIILQFLVEFNSIFACLFFFCIFKTAKIIDFFLIRHYVFNLYLIKNYAFKKKKIKYTRDAPSNKYN